MGLGDKIQNAGEEAAGKVKETTGRATDNGSLEAEGKADQASANIKQAGEKARTPSRTPWSDQRPTTKDTRHHPDTPRLTQGLTEAALTARIGRMLEAASGSFYRKLW